jgi:hypothetical protein
MLQNSSVDWGWLWLRRILQRGFDLARELGGFRDEHHAVANGGEHATI